MLKNIINYIVVQTMIMLAGISSANAFTCKDATGKVLYAGNPGGGAITHTVDVYVNLQPSIEVGQNLVVDVARSVFCKNDNPAGRNDITSMLRGSAYGGALANFRGSLRYYGSYYGFPLSSETAGYNITSGVYVPWNTQLYLTPISAAGGVVITSGSHFATLSLRHFGSDINGGGNPHTATYNWKLYSNNSVVVPTGGCDVSARNVTVTLPEYPGSAAIPITVRCARNQRLIYYLSGSTADASNTIFTNNASGSAAKGIGIQLKKNGQTLVSNRRVLLGTVGSSSVSLGLTAHYARTYGQVTAGNVQSVIGVTFVYE